MSLQATVSPKPPAEKALDFEALRRAGIAHLERLAPDLWTDFNSHDPGITLLEVICFALTDLAYRVSLPIEDLVAPAPVEPTPPVPDSDTTRVLERHGAFYTALEILTTAPVTALDLRKLIIDRVPEVINVWLRPHVRHHYVACFTANQGLRPTEEPGPSGSYSLKGLWELVLDLQVGLTQAERDQVLEQVRALYHANRNLGEDLGALRVVDAQEVMFCADIALTPDADLDQVAATIIHGVQQHLSPPVPRHTLEQLQASNLAFDEIYEGPELRNGFILDSELEAASLPTEVCAGELVSLIMDIPGVQAVRALQLNYADPAEKLARGEALGCLPVKTGCKPVLAVEDCVLHFFKDGLPFAENEQRVDHELDVLREAAAQTGLISGDRPIPYGRHRELGGHLSIQQDLPVAYGLAPHGLPSTASEERRVKARQLQGFLLLFDQLLANFLGQLKQLQELFSTDPELRRTYFEEVVSGFGDICELLQDPNGEHVRCREAEQEQDRDQARESLQTHYHERIREMLEGNAHNSARRNRFLDHLLARFGERFTDYVLLVQQLFEEGTGSSAIAAKGRFLREYPYLSRRRGNGHNLYDPDEQWDTDNVSGVEHRISRLLGFPSIRRRNQANVFSLLYEQIDEDSANDFRFRIRQSSTSRVLLSSSTRYDTREAAAAELEQATYLALDPARYELLQDQRGRFYFNIVDAGGEVVARRIQYFPTEQERAEAIAELREELETRYSMEGMFLVENLLLRPRKEADDFLPICPDTACADLQSRDPYSWRLWVILPAFGPRLGDVRFRRFVERTIRRELPAHLLARICFVNADHMGRFEVAWREWLEYRSRHRQGEMGTDESLNRLLDVLAELHTQYPPGRLHDCVEDGDEESALVLTRSHLGNSLAPAGEQPRDEREGD